MALDASPPLGSSHPGFSFPSWQSPLWYIKGPWAGVRGFKVTSQSSRELAVNLGKSLDLAEFASPAALFTEGCKDEM